MKIKVNEADFYSDEDMGACRECGEFAYGVEPDARKYECESCGAKEVFGLQELLIMDELEIE